MMKRNWSKQPSQSLSLATLESYLPLNTVGRTKIGYEQDVVYRMKRVFRFFWTEARKNLNEVSRTVSVLPPVNQDEDWRLLVLLTAEICNSHYSLHKTGKSESDGIEVCFTGYGTQPELSMKLLVFLWPRYCQCRHRAWQKYVRSMRRRAGAEIQVTSKLRVLWQRDHSLQWILTIWQDLGKKERQEWRHN